MENKDNVMVFGLDIGTRNVVGTVGYKSGREFIVVAQYTLEHETRSMMDGQIHDINRVGRTILAVKEELQQQIGHELSMVCIAAAGRVLKTVTTSISHEFEEESSVLAEDIHTLELMGIERAQDILKEQNDTKYKYYCVGYTAVRYYLDDEAISNLEGHKAAKIAEDMIVTFLPESVVDSLYAAVELAGLSVASLTLEPIAAIGIVIPESFRMLNIAMVDVGAGTSDISVTKEGSIIAYGMIPLAGDEITELIVQKYLVDFRTAEKMKLASTTDEEITYRDIMSIEYKIPAQEIWDLTAPIVDKITTCVADKIRELNGDNSVSATFVVGGGGKIHGFTELLAQKLDLPPERVALRGEEVLQEVIFEQPEIQKDPLIVTPIGICLNYFEQQNNFIMVHFNGERVKLYDNKKLTIVDAALQAGFPNENLFPKRGREIRITVNGEPRIFRGEAGESAVILVNEKPANINTPLLPNSYITVFPSTAGSDASVRIDELKEYTEGTVSFIVNGHIIHCPKFVEVNGALAGYNYQIQSEDVIETRNFYTVSELAEFMDMEIDMSHEIMVNNRPAETNTLLYENFSVDWVANPMEHYEAALVDEEVVSADEDAQLSGETQESSTETGAEAETVTAGGMDPEVVAKIDEPAIETAAQPAFLELMVYVNEMAITLKGKSEYVFVDVFDYIDFDLRASGGRAIITEVNQQTAEFTQILNQGDRISIYWKEN